jgi:hypothetical protein
MVPARRRVDPITTVPETGRVAASVELQQVFIMNIDEQEM